MIPEFNFKGRPLTENETKKFIGLCLNKTDEEYLDKSDLKDQFFSRVLLKRIDYYKLPFKLTDFFMAISVLTFVDRVGFVVVLLRLCYQHWKKTGKSDFNIDEWAYMFPMGVPTKEELKKMWDSQKNFERIEGNPENLLDDPSEWN